MDLDRLISEYDDFEYCYPSIIDIAIVKKNHKVGVIDKKFNILIPLIYETIYIAKSSPKRMIAQRNNTWFVLDDKNNILYESKHNYNPSLKYKLSCFDESHYYVAYYDGYIEHFKDKIVLVTKDQKKEFFIESKSAMCVDNTPLVYFFDGTKKGCLNLETSSLENDILQDIRKRFYRLKAYNIDSKLSIGENPYSLFEQELLIQELKDDGITTIISIERKPEIKYDIKVLKNKFYIVNIPVVDNSVPTIESLDKIITTIDKSKKCYIHCEPESNRLGVVVAYYLHIKYTYQGQNILKKIEELQTESRYSKAALVISKEQKEFILSL